MPLVPRLLAGFWLAACLGVLTGGCGSRAAAPETPPTPGAPAPSVADPETPPAEAPESTDPSSADAAAAGRESPECRHIAGAGEPVSTVALTESVDPAHAPHPANDSERIVFRQLYETLVRVDCEGRLLPGLAASWQRSGAGGGWQFVLRDDARFSDGTPVTSADVVASLAPRVGECSDPRLGERCAIEAISVIGGHPVVMLREPDDPRVLADTRLAIVKRAPGASWPHGTRGLEVAAGSASGATGHGEITLTRTSGWRATAGNGPAPVLRFLIDPGRDPRDFLDQGVDLLLTRDPGTLDYAATLPRYAPVALDWQRTRVFLSHWRMASTGVLPFDARQALAADAVRGDSRGAQGPFWWQELAACEIGTTAAAPAASEAPTGRIVYSPDDPASRDLAERLVGLAAIRQPAAASIVETLLPGEPRRLYQRAVGLPDTSFGAAVARGADSGYIVSFDRRPVNPCQEWRAVATRAPWLEPSTVVPLVDTRLWAIVVQGGSGITVEWDGGLLLSGAESGR